MSNIPDYMSNIPQLYVGFELRIYKYIILKFEIKVNIMSEGVTFSEEDFLMSSCGFNFTKCNFRVYIIEYKLHWTKLDICIAIDWT